MTRRKSVRRTTIDDVAKLAGVSISTVSRVVSGNAPVNEDTATRVQRAIEELNYKPSTAARALSDRRTNAFGLLVSEIAAPYYLYLLRGIEMAVREAGLGLLINSVGMSENQQEKTRPFLGEHNTDGIIVSSGSLPDEELQRLHELGLPLVLLHRTSPNGLSIPSLNVDNQAGIKAIIDHLVTVHGHQRIAFLRGPESEEDSYWRELGYREALQAHGLPIDPSLIGYGGFDEYISYTMVSEWLDSGMSFDAIFTGNDEAAPGVLNALNEHGLRVPEDVAVVGFDDDHLASRLTPKLTTVRSPIEQLGKEAVAQLLSLMEGKPTPSKILPIELIVRQSCGCSG